MSPVFFETSTRNLLDAEATAGIGHHVVLTIVGTDRPSGISYFHAKRAQEKLIEGSSIPYSIVHATQFFEFLGRIADGATDGDTVRLPPVRFQPMAADDVAAAMGRTAVGEPSNGRIEIAGPDRGRFDEIVGRYLAFHQDPRRVVADPHAPYFSAEVEELTLVPVDGTAELGETRFEDWLARS